MSTETELTETELRELAKANGFSVIHYTDSGLYQVTHSIVISNPLPTLAEALMDCVYGVFRKAVRHATDAQNIIDALSPNAAEADSSARISK